MSMIIEERHLCWLNFYELKRKIIIGWVLTTLMDMTQPTRVIKLEIENPEHKKMFDRLQL